MKVYAVEMTGVAESGIYEHARYIAVERREPVSAVRWLESTMDAVRSLETMPYRCALAEENDAVDYEVRQLPVGSPALLITVDDDRRIVWVFAFRGEGQLSRPDRLPESLDALREEGEE